MFSVCSFYDMIVLGLSKRCQRDNWKYIYIYSFIIPTLDGDWRQFCSSFFRTFWKLARNIFVNIQNPQARWWAMNGGTGTMRFLTVDRQNPAESVEVGNVSSVIWPRCWSMMTRSLCTKMTDANRCWNLGCTTCSWFQWALTGPPDPVINGVKQLL